MKKPTYEELEKKIEELERTADLFRLFADYTVDWEFFRDTSGKILYCNKAIQTITGYPADDFISGKITEKDLIHPGDWDFVSDKMEKARQQIEPECNISFRILTKGDETRYMDSCSLPVYGDGNYIGNRTIIRDVTDRKISETALQLSIEKLRAFINNTTSSIGIYDNNMYLTEINETGQKWWPHLTREEIIGKHITTLIPDVDPVLINQLNHVIQSGERFLDYQHIPSGQFGDLVMEFEAFSIPGGFAIVTHDITEKSRKDKQLHENEEKFRTVFNNSPIALEIYDRNGIVTDCNQKTLEMFGIKKEEVIGNFNLHNDPNYQYPEIWEKLNAGEAVHHKIEMQFDRTPYSTTHSGIKYLDVLTTPIPETVSSEIGYIMQIIDITEQKIAEIELIKAKEKAEENEEKFSVAFKYAPVMFTISNIDDGKYLDVNDEFLRISGFDYPEVIGKTSIELGWLIPDDRKKLVSLLREKGRAEIEELLLYNYNRQPVICHYQGELITIGQQKYLLSIAQDITQKKMNEYELTKAKENAEESDRLKSMFLQNLSHEIRTPMNSIIGFSDVINQPGLSEEKRKSYSTIIQNSSHQLLSIVEDILTISSLETKQEKVDIHVVNINSLIIDLVATFKNQAQSKNLLFNSKVSLSDKNSDIFSDRTKLIQILTNLITNALKFTHEGFIEFGYKINASGAPAEIQFFVKDSGIGIKAEMLEKVFDRFRQADRSIQANYGGTGLGLAISRGFVELLGGKIWVESEVNKGSAFYFTIPFNPVNESTFKEIARGKNLGGTTIVVAEDEEFNFLYVAELLTGFDFQLIHTKDGQETIEYFMAHQDIDLILMDIKMPFMTGDEAARIIKAIKPDLPIIAQSAYALEHERAKYEQLFDDYLAKPVSRHELKQKIHKYLSPEKEK